MAEPAIPMDRRQRRRQESIEEILDVAVELMAEAGVAGLSLGDVARRMGIRTPSLYGYFTAKTAVYDAVFARGARQVLDTVVAVRPQVDAAGSLDEALSVIATALVRWAVENPVYTQLLFWRPVPGFEPSPDAYAPAVEMVGAARGAMADLQARGWIRAGADIDDLLRDWTILIAGVVSQQLSNAPAESFDSGRFTAALPNLVAMFADHYAAPTRARPPRAGSTPTATTRTRSAKPRSSTSAGRTRNAHSR